LDERGDKSPNPLLWLRACPCPLNFSDKKIGKYPSNFYFKFNAKKNKFNQSAHSKIYLYSK